MEPSGRLRPVPSVDRSIATVGRRATRDKQFALKQLIQQRMTTLNVGEPLSDQRSGCVFTELGEQECYGRAGYSRGLLEEVLNDVL
jgi:hypothetical protein